MATKDKVRKAIVELHDFFTAWFRGTAAKTDLAEQLMDRMHADFVMIPPQGSMIPKEAMRGGLMAGYASNPHFKIEIRDVRIHHVMGTKVLASYTEWQKSAQNSNAQNARLSTVLLDVGPPLQWLHLQETWLPESAKTEGSFDF